MRLVLFFVAALIACPVSAYAQDAVAVDPKHYKVELENDQVRVLRITYAPGEKSVMHEHPANVAVFLTDGLGKFTLPGGESQDVSFRAGGIQSDAGGTHLPENIGAERFELVLVELKSKAAGGANQAGEEEQAVRQLLNELAAAVGRNDTATLDRIYADDYTFASESGVLTAKAQRLAAMKSGDLKYDSVSFDETDVRIYDNTAIATFRVMSEGESNGQAFGGEYLVTATFVKMNGRWQEVAAQTTRITEP